MSDAVRRTLFVLASLLLILASAGPTMADLSGTGVAVGRDFMLGYQAFGDIAVIQLGSR